jgi:hypothetical protein
MASFDYDVVFIGSGFGGSAARCALRTRRARDARRPLLLQQHGQRAVLRWQRDVRGLASSTLRTLRLDGADTAEVSRGPRSAQPPTIGSPSACHGLDQAAFDDVADWSATCGRTLELGPMTAARTSAIPDAAARARAIRLAVATSSARMFTCHGARLVRSSPTMR